MHRLSAALALVSVFLVATGAGANAQYLPSGSYQASCRNISMTGNVLSASCTDPQGNYRWSRINVRSCAGGGIANQNGHLRCGSSGGSTMLPMGSYQASCVDVAMRGPILSARCTRPSGGRVYSSLDVRQCGTPNVRNQNGNLACGAPASY